LPNCFPRLVAPGRDYHQLLLGKLSSELLDYGMRRPNAMPTQTRTKELNERSRTTQRMSVRVRSTSLHRVCRQYPGGCGATTSWLLVDGEVLSKAMAQYLSCRLDRRFLLQPCMWNRQCILENCLLWPGSSE